MAQILQQASLAYMSASCPPSINFVSDRLSSRASELSANMHQHNDAPLLILPHPLLTFLRLAFSTGRSIRVSRFPSPWALVHALSAVC